jgi:hypothetical protein
MRRIALTLVLALVLIALVSAGCAPGSNNAQKTPSAEGKVAGFWLGLWHGLISPITFIVSLFDRGVNLYEIHNNGNWYNFGFVIGAGLFLSGGILGKKRRQS